MSRSVLVTGATGLLGRQVVIAFKREGWIVTGAGYTRAKPPSILKVDLGSETEINALLDEVKPDVIVHCAANRFPDKCDSDPEGTRALNVEASRSLAAAASCRSIFLINISTDYVYPGTKGDAPYETTHTPKPPNLYGETKHDGETAVLGEYKKAGKEGWGVVLRVPVLYGQAESPSESAVNVLMDSVWKAQGKDSIISMDHWALRYPTNTEDVGRVCQGASPRLPTLIADLAAKYLGTPDKISLPTILQFSSEDRFTKYEITQLFGEIMGLSTANIKPNTEGNDLKSVVQRPYDCHLSTKSLKDIGVAVHTQDFIGWWRRECRAFRK